LVPLTFFSKFYPLQSRKDKNLEAVRIQALHHPKSPVFRGSVSPTFFKLLSFQSRKDQNWLPLEFFENFIAFFLALLYPDSDIE